MRSRADIIAGILFGVIAIIHLARLLCPFDVVIANYHVPMWVSIIGFLVPGLLSAWLFRSREV